MIMLGSFRIVLRIYGTGCSRRVVVLVLSSSKLLISPSMLPLEGQRGVAWGSVGSFTRRVTVNWA